MKRPQTLGRRLAQARREMAVREHRDVTAAEVAKAAGVSSASLSQWENDERVPRDPALLRLAAFLGVSPAYLRYGTGAPGLVDDLINPATDRKLTAEEIDRARAAVAAAHASKTTGAKKRGRRA